MTKLSAARSREDPSADYSSGSFGRGEVVDMACLLIYAATSLLPGKTTEVYMPNNGSESNRLQTSGNSAIEPSDAELIKRALGEDQAALVMLWERHRGKIRSLCLSLTKNPADAEDCLQETFIKVLKNLRTFRGDALFSTWLYRIASNECFMVLRKKERLPATMPIDLIGHYKDHAADEEMIIEPGEDSDRSPSSDHPSDFGKPDAFVEATPERFLVQELLGELAPGFRQVLMLRYFGGYEISEIAEVLGCSIGNVKSRLCRGRISLSIHLAEKYNIHMESKDTERKGVSNLRKILKNFAPRMLATRA